MNLIEFIGFIISMVALFVLMHKQSKEAKRRKEHPEEFAEEQVEEEAALQELLHTLNIQQQPTPPVINSKKVTRARPREVQVPRVKEEELPPSKIKLAKVPPKKFIDPYKKSHIDHAKLKSKKDLLKKISLQDAVVLSAILGPPKGQ